MATIQQGNAQNFLGKQSTAKYSNFDWSGHVYTTQRFGQIQPIIAISAIQGDEWRIRNAHKLTTYTLSAPLMNELHMEKDFFLVPRQALLPRSWDKISIQPNIGDDVDATVVGTSVKAEIWSEFLETLETEKKLASETILTATTSADAIKAAENAIKYLMVAQYIYSYGSLLNVTGTKMAALWRQDDRTNAKTAGFLAENFDEIFEKIISKITYGLRIKDDNGTVYDVAVNLDLVNSVNRISMHDFLEKAQDDFSWELIGIWTSTTTLKTASSALTDVQTALTTISNGIKYTTTPTGEQQYGQPVDLARCWAYQMVCAEFFTCDSVDYVYNAELFREYIGSIVYTINGTYDKYNYNGLTVEYDYMSAYYFGMQAEQIDFDYCAALFSYKRSLKYRDYFVGAKVRPLAVGNITIGTDAQGNVAVEDITKGIQSQRFYNALNRVGRKVEEYAKEFRGVKMARDYHNPIWLGSTRDVVKPYETENTGEAQITTQNAVTARLESYGGNARFIINVDRDGIILGLAFYDLERSYARGTDRAISHVDRYDMFNEYMQYTGDQALLQSELDTHDAAGGQDGIFGYVPAYEEFKQNYNRALAGFVTALPGYTFIDGMEKSYGGYRPEAKHISPDFIRCKPVELDRYYNSITGNSYSNYFHFIIDFYNEINVKRPMVFNPQIL